jgi:hypothetical protein
MTTERSMPESIKCECGRTSIVHGDADLCVHCFYKLALAQTLQFRNAAIGANAAAADMDFISGIPGFTPRMQVPDLPRAPMTLNNINVDRSIVGAINTAEVGSIDVSITVLDQAGNKAVGEALKALTQAIVDADLPKDDKGAMIDQVAYLGEQAAAAAKDRKPGMIKAAFSALNDATLKTALTVSAVSTAWSAAAPILKGHFGL